MKIYIISAMSLLIVACEAKHNSKGLNSDTTISNTYFFNRQDTLAMKISKTAFDSLISVYSAKIKNGDSLLVDDYITMTRIINTIQHHYLNSARYSEFKRLYFPKILTESIKATDALPWKGECYYSKKYDIFLGGLPHENSEYSFH